MAALMSERFAHAWAHAYEATLVGDTDRMFLALDEIKVVIEELRAFERAVLGEELMVKVREVEA